jgi:hypothetical protein
MGLSIRFHSGEPKFKGINYFSRPIFNLTVAARIGHNTTTFQCVKEIQNKAINAGLAVQVPSQAQAHIPIIIPIFLTEGMGAIPDKGEKDRLFDKLVDVLRQVMPTCLMFPSQIPRFDEIFVGQQDVRLMASRSDKLTLAQSDLQKGVQQLLDSRFDFPGGLPNIDGKVFTAILRFKEGFSEANYAKLMKILENTSGKFENNALEMLISPDNIKVVQFDSLFEPWVKEA